MDIRIFCAKYIQNFRFFVRISGKVLKNGLVAISTAFLMLAAPAFAADTFNPADYVSPEYGHKDNATDVLYFGFDSSGGNGVLAEATAENHDFAYYIDISRCSSGSMSIDVGDSDKDFIDIAIDSQTAVLSFMSGGNVTGDFVGISTTNSSFVHGAAVHISNAGADSIEGNFINNSVISQSHYAIGGAISAGGGIKEIAGNFIGNSALGYSNTFGGGAIFVWNNRSIESVKGNFIGNYTNTNGGAIYSDSNSNITNIAGLFAGNFVSGKQLSRGGAICNLGIIGEISASFINNSAKTNSTSQLALGGAIYTREDLNIAADNKNIEFTGNYTKDSRGEIPNAIFVATKADSTPTITLNATNSGTITFNDQIDGGTVIGSTVNRDYAYNLALTGDKSSKIMLNNEIINANIQINDTNVFLDNAANFAQSKSLALNSGTLNIAILENEVKFESLSNAGTIIINTVAVDGANKTSGKLSAETYGTQTGSIIIDNIRLISEPTQQITEINFANPNYLQNVTYSGSRETYYPIYKYDISYNSANGNFILNRSFNPAVLASSVAQTAGTYISQLQTYNYAFNHSDYYMNFPRAKRLAIKNKNKITLLGSHNPKFFNHKYSNPEKPAFWVKNYASFESVPLSGGVDVSNINYGTIIGHDSEIEDLKNGWQRVITTYIGYNGSSQRYSGIDAYQNGGSLGSAATFYKNNFFNATTIAANASSGDANTMYGRENFAIFAAGIANKTGYNFEFARGKFIVQPNFLISYTYLNTFDYINAAGVKIDSNPLNALQLAPGIKFIANTKSGWQPYIALSVVWNIMDKSKVTANDLRIPSLGIDPYVQYGIGVQRQPTENLTAYAQAMIHNGGRNGVSLSFGLRWAIGRKNR